MPNIIQKYLNERSLKDFQLSKRVLRVLPEFILLSKQPAHQAKYIENIIIINIGSYMKRKYKSTLFASFAKFFAGSTPSIFLNPTSLNGLSATPSLLPMSII